MWFNSVCPLVIPVSWADMYQVSQNYPFCFYERCISFKGGLKKKSQVAEMTP